MNREDWYEVGQITDDGSTCSSQEFPRLGLAVDAALGRSADDPEHYYFVDRWYRDLDTEHQDSELDENFAGIYFKAGNVVESPHHEEGQQPSRPTRIQPDHPAPERETERPKRIEKALAKSKNLCTNTLADFLKSALSMSGDELLNIRGHANSILVAQFVAFAKTQINITEELVLKDEPLERLKKAIQRNDALSNSQM